PHGRRRSRKEECRPSGERQSLSARQAAEPQGRMSTLRGKAEPFRTAGGGAARKNVDPPGKGRAFPNGKRRSREGEGGSSGEGRAFPYSRRRSRKEECRPSGERQSLSARQAAEPQGRVSNLRGRQSLSAQQAAETQGDVLTPVPRRGPAK